MWGYTPEACRIRKSGGRRDGAQLASLIAEDVVWPVPGGDTQDMASDIHGRTALPAWLGELRAKGFWLTELTCSAAITTSVR